MIAAHGITVRRGAACLLDDVSLSIDTGEVVALVGPNGAGKSTLLNVLAADVAPTSGTVRINNRSVSSYSPKSLARLRAVVPQQSSLDFDFLVHEVVAMGRAPWTDSAVARDDAIVRASLSMVELESLAIRRYPTLSGGEQQRVHLARAIAQVWPHADRDATSSRVLLLDEPVSSLDPQHQHRVLQIARAVAEHGVAVLVILHDLNLAVQYADRIALLCGGRLRAVGPSRTILDARVLSDVYGTPFDIVAHPCADCPLIVARPAWWVDQ
jgi:iron complex transport system ATP-binding protein